MDSFRLLCFKLLLPFLNQVEDALRLASTCKELFHTIHSDNHWAKDMWENLYVSKYGNWKRKTIHDEKLTLNHLKKTAKTIADVQNQSYVQRTHHFNVDCGYTTGLYTCYILDKHIIIQQNYRTVRVYSFETGKGQSFTFPYSWSETISVYDRYVVFQSEPD